MTNILVIDDCEIFRELLGMVLQDSGHTPVEASSLTEALSALERDKIDLVFCDLMMPTEFEEGVPDESAMVGVSAIKEIKDRYPSVPIVAISGKMAHQPLQGLTKFGADAGICKPFNQENLINVVNSLLGKSVVTVKAQTG